MGKLKFWFKYNKIFWNLRYETRYKLCGYEIDRIPYKVWYIKHIWTNKVVYDEYNLCYSKECFNQSLIYKLCGVDNKTLMKQLKKDYK